MTAGYPDGHGGSARETSAPVAFAIEPLAAPAGTVALRLAGELDVSTGSEVRDAVDSAVAGGATGLLLDMEDVTFMDSSMLRELLRAQGELRSRGGVVVLVAPQPAILRLLELTRTAALFSVAETREDGLARVTAAA